MRESGAKQILVVDHDVDTRDAVRAALVATGYVVEQASDAADGIAAFRHVKPDGVVVALELPRSDGLAFMRMLRGDPDGLESPIVVLSQDASRKTEAEALGARAYMVKPLDMAQLVAKLSILTSGSQEAVRDHQRFDHVEEVEVKCEGWKHFVEMVTDNVSKGGIFIASNSPPPVFTRIRVRFAARGEGGRDMVLDGEVRHVVSPERAIARQVAAGMGVRFDEIAPEMVKVIEGLVKRASTPKMKAVRSSTPPPIATVPPEELSAEARDKLDGLMEELGIMRERDFYDRLDIAPDAGPGVVKQAFRAAARKYHPDRFASEPEALRDAAQEIYLLIAEAKKHLDDPAVRERVRNAKASPLSQRKPRSPMGVPTRTRRKPVRNGRVDMSPTPRVRPTVNRAADTRRADAKPARAKPIEEKPASNRGHDPRRASRGGADARRDEVSASLRTSPKDSGARAAPAAANASVHPREVIRAKQALADGRHREAMEGLIRAIGGGFASPDMLLSLELARGHVCQDEGQYGRAREHFQRACEMDPQCIPAIRALRGLGL